MSEPETMPSFGLVSVCKHRTDFIAVRVLESTTTEWDDDPYGGFMTLTVQTVSPYRPKNVPDRTKAFYEHTEDYYPIGFVQIMLADFGFYDGEIKAQSVVSIEPDDIAWNVADLMYNPETGEPN